MARRVKLEPEIDREVVLDIPQVRVETTQVKLSKGKHMEIKMLVPYSEENVEGFGELAGLDGIHGRIELKVRGLFYAMDDGEEGQLVLDPGKAEVEQ